MVKRLADRTALGQDAVGAPHQRVGILDLPRGLFRQPPNVVVDAASGLF